MAKGQGEHRVGTWLRGKWRVERLLGSGGMATVYEARHRNRARAAIKILHPELAAEPRAVERFRREAYIVNGVDHPAVVRVVDDDETAEGEPFLVMELVEGETLDEAITKGPLDGPELLDVAEQVLDALVVAHAAGIVHRDLKPQNLLRDRDGRIRILDFGIAKVLDDESLRTMLTTHGMVWGTFEYMAPEQLTGNAEISARTDLFALGATLFMLASYEHLHEGADVRKRVLRAATTPARSLAEVCPELDPAIVALVDRATRTEIGARWPSAELMLHEVRRLRGVLSARPATRTQSARRPIAKAMGTRPLFGLPASSDRSPTADAGPRSEERSTKRIVRGGSGTKPFFVPSPGAREAVLPPPVELEVAAAASHKLALSEAPSIEIVAIEPIDRDTLVSPPLESLRTRPGRIPRAPVKLALAVCLCVLAACFAASRQRRAPGSSDERATGPTTVARFAPTPATAATPAVVTTPPAPPSVPPRPNEKRKATAGAPREFAVEPRAPHPAVEPPGPY